MTMNGLIRPHGGELRPLWVDDASKAQQLLERSESLVQIKMSSKEASDLLMLSMGAFSPLKGFAGRDDYQSILESMHLADGTLWPIPITLSVTQAQADELSDGQRVALVDPDSGDILGSMIVEEKYTYDKQREAAAVFGTDDEAHPGVKKLYAQGEVYLGGPVEVFSEGGYPEMFSEYARPAETRAIFREKGWKTIAAFQTRNPMHRSHEHLTKIAMEMCDGVLIHPVVGKLKEGDIPAEVRIKCYNTLLDRYYPKDKALLKVYPMEMRYGGPKEAVLHAIIRQNFGCSHMIIGRDHAGVGNYYEPFEAQEIFDKLQPGDLTIKPLKLEWSYWCYKCGAMTSDSLCPHSSEDHCTISGTKLRAMLSQGQRPPEEFGRPEVIEILIDFYKKRNRS